MKKWIQKQKIETILFLISLLFLLTIGVVLSYNYKVGDNYNLLFDSDTARVVRDAIDLKADHYRSSVHPLFVLFVQPVVSIISGFVLNKNLALIILSAFVSSLSVYYLYKLLDSIKPNKIINSLVCLIYLFSFSNMIFTSGIETYNFASLFLIMMWYYYQKQDKKPINGYSYVMLILFGILTFAFTMTNVCIYLIMIFLLWIAKKINIKQILIVGVITISLVLGLNITQKLVFHTTPVLWNLNIKEEQNFVNKEKFGKNNIKEVVVNDYYNSLISNNIHLKLSYGNFYNGQNYYLVFNDMNIFNFLLITGFYIFLLFLVVRNFKKNKMLNSGLLLSLAFNTILHLFYGNNSTFLYSLHFLYCILLLLGINLLTEENKKLQKVFMIYLSFFLLVEVIINHVIFGKTIHFVKEIIESNLLVAYLGLAKTILIEILVILFIIGIILLGVWLMKKSIHTKQKETRVLSLISLLALTIIIESIFISFENVENHQRFLWKKIEDTRTEFVPKEKIDYLSADFKNQFQEELIKLNDYKEEINQFKKEYTTTSVVDTGWSDYYYFGFGNRRKLIYRPNSILDIDTKKEVIHFEEKEHYIIPNTYTVLIETKENDYIILKEDEEGVHYILNGKDNILDGTNTKMNLYKFENQKYQNMMKVLYGEILWNIKDSIIYPNSIVYEKPWYRDAAITCMVLKETNNLDLITEWVTSIQDLYDKQNKGIEEADNLGELLYILSTQENRNEQLIDRIEAEAERIATSNPNGYYLYGKTDFGDQYYYQNLWYQLGIESVGRRYHFDRESIPKDSYSKTAWWSSYQPTTEENEFQDRFYPYLTLAERHQLKKGTIFLNDNLYPLSWEIAASEANYENYRGLDDYMANAKVSPLHSWSASELLLLLLDDAGQLQSE